MREEGRRQGNGRERRNIKHREHGNKAENRGKWGTRREKEEGVRI